MDDRRLLIRMRRGSDDAARQLLGLHAQAMAASARAVLPRGDGREHDAVQQVLLAVLRRPARDVREVSDVRAYLCRAARHAALTMARADTRRARTERATTPDHPSGAPATDPLARAVDDLDDDLREAVLLRHGACMTFDQMAETTGVPRGTLVARYGRALDALRSRLGSREHDPQECAP